MRSHSRISAPGAPRPQRLWPLSGDLRAYPANREGQQRVEGGRTQSERRSSHRWAAGRERERGLIALFRRPRHARRRATHAEAYLATHCSHTSYLKSAPTSEWPALRQWRASRSPTAVRSFVPAPASPRRRNRWATGRRRDVVYQKPPILRLAQRGPRRRARECVRTQRRARPLRRPHG